MKKFSTTIELPIIGKTIDLLVPQNISFEILIEMIREFIFEHFDLDNSGDLYIAETGMKVKEEFSMNMLKQGKGYRFIFM